MDIDQPNRPLCCRSFRQSCDNGAARSRTPTLVANHNPNDYCGHFCNSRGRRTVQMATSKGLRILVVDDEPLVCDSVRRMLAIDDHRVEMATSAEAAFALSEKEIFDLVITDYKLPVMNGDKLAAAIKARQPNLPIALITAYAES